jgi:hypothetical protein
VIYTFPELERAGRLGNQAFQIAGTLGIARAHGGEPRFPTTWSYRPFFSIPDEYFSDEPGTPAWKLATGIDERIRIHLQDVSLWQDVEDTVSAWFAPSPEALARLRLMPIYNVPIRTIALHVRRGDYVQESDSFWVPTLEYFTRAIGLLSTDVPIVIFSDGPDWCRKALLPLLGDRATVYEGVPRLKPEEPGYRKEEEPLDWIDLFAMARMALHVTSNSSYSWWGAWLSSDPSPIAPLRWYGPKLSWISPEPIFRATRGWLRA